MKYTVQDCFKVDKLNYVLQALARLHPAPAATRRQRAKLHVLLVAVFGYFAGEVDVPPWLPKEELIVLIGVIEQGWQWVVDNPQYNAGFTIPTDRRRVVRLIASPIQAAVTDLAVVSI
jgi:hypothetical protein